MHPHLGRIKRLAPDQQRTEMPGRIARLNQDPVKPQHVRNGEHEQHRRSAAQHMHRDQVRVLPIPPRHAIKEPDQRPGRPQPGQLGDRHVDYAGQRARLIPIDPGRGAAVDFADQHFPQDHRRGRNHQSGQRGIRPGQALGAARQAQGSDNLGPEMAHHDPPGQRDQPAQPDRDRNVAGGAPIGSWIG